MNDKDKFVARPIPHRDSITSIQLDNLLSVAGLLIAAFTNPKREMENIPGRNDPPPEAMIAAENTFVKVCERLDAILGDETRWSMKFQDELEKKVSEAHNLQMEFLKNQSAVSAEILTPHFRYRPSIGKLPDGNWVAILGDPAAPNAIAGIGITPAAAIKAFDDIFNGAVPQYMIDWLNSHEKAIETGNQSPPWPSPPKQNNEKALDGLRDKRASRAKRRGENPGGNSEGTEPLTGLS